MFGSEPYLVEIGDNTYLSGAETQLLTHDGGISSLHYMGGTEGKYDIFGWIRIGSNCFIGVRSIIMKNVTIGDNCIVGAGAVVTRSVPSGSVVAGVPARVICTVEEYYQKNQPALEATTRLSAFDKRQHILDNMDRYEAIRREREA